MQHRARKRFSQNFLRDAGKIQQIIAAVNPRPGQRILEVGPGQGALTRLLLASGAEVRAVEIDRDLCQHLERTCVPLGLKLEQGDALKWQLPEAWQTGEPVRVVANVPYHISTPLLFHWLDWGPCVQDMHLMLQKEVVQRLAAGPGSKIYGRLSVMVQSRCQVQALFDVPAECFSPPPRVVSAVVGVQRRTDAWPEAAMPALDRVVRAAFQARRKTLRKALKNLLDDAAMQDCGINPQWRAEQVDVAGFQRMANRLNK